jgi:hypothetical protein
MANTTGSISLSGYTNDTVNNRFTVARGSNTTLSAALSDDSGIDNDSGSWVWIVCYTLPTGGTKTRSYYDNTSAGNIAVGGGTMLSTCNVSPYTDPAAIWIRPLVTYSSTKYPGGTAIMGSIVYLTGVAPTTTTTTKATTTTTTKATTTTTTKATTTTTTKPTTTTTTKATTTTTATPTSTTKATTTTKAPTSTTTKATTTTTSPPEDTPGEITVTDSSGTDVAGNNNDIIIGETHTITLTDVDDPDLSSIIWYRRALGSPDKSTVTATVNSAPYPQLKIVNGSGGLAVTYTNADVRTAYQTVQFEVKYTDSAHPDEYISVFSEVLNRVTAPTTTSTKKPTTTTTKKPTTSTTAKPTTSTTTKKTTTTSTKKPTTTTTRKPTSTTSTKKPTTTTTRKPTTTTTIKPTTTTPPLPDIGLTLVVNNGPAPSIVTTTGGEYGRVGDDKIYQDDPVPMKYLDTYSVTVYDSSFPNNTPNTITKTLIEYAEVAATNVPYITTKLRTATLVGLGTVALAPPKITGNAYYVRAIVTYPDIAGKAKTVRAWWPINIVNQKYTTLIVNDDVDNGKTLAAGDILSSVTLKNRDTITARSRNNMWVKPDVPKTIIMQLYIGIPGTFDRTKPGTPCAIKTKPSLELVPGVKSHWTVGLDLLNDPGERYFMQLISNGVVSGTVVDTYSVWYEINFIEEYGTITLKVNDNTYGPVLNKNIFSPPVPMDTKSLITATTQDVNKIDEKATVITGKFLNVPLSATKDHDTMSKLANPPSIDIFRANTIAKAQTAPLQDNELYFWVTASYNSYSLSGKTSLIAWYPVSWQGALPGLIVLSGPRLTPKAGTDEYNGEISSVVLAKLVAPDAYAYPDANAGFTWKWILRAPNKTDVEYTSKSTNVVISADGLSSSFVIPTNAFAGYQLFAYVEYADPSHLVKATPAQIPAKAISVAINRTPANALTKDLVGKIEVWSYGILVNPIKGVVTLPPEAPVTIKLVDTDGIFPDTTDWGPGFADNKWPWMLTSQSMVSTVTNLVKTDTQLTFNRLTWADILGFWREAGTYKDYPLVSTVTYNDPWHPIAKASIVMPKIVFNFTRNLPMIHMYWSNGEMLTAYTSGDTTKWGELDPITPHAPAGKRLSALYVDGSTSTVDTSSNWWWDYYTKNAIAADFWGDGVNKHIPGLSIGSRVGEANASASRNPCIAVRNYTEKQTAPGYINNIGPSVSRKIVSPRIWIDPAPVIGTGGTVVLTSDPYWNGVNNHTTAYPYTEITATFTGSGNKVGALGFCWYVGGKFVRYAHSSSGVVFTDKFTPENPQVPPGTSSATAYSEYSTEVTCKVLWTNLPGASRAYFFTALATITVNS